VDVCVSETVDKDPGVNTTFTCPPFSIFCSVAFSAVGVPSGNNTCDGGTARFVVTDCGYNITAYMAAKCVGQPTCNFTNDDLYASGFLAHACPAYNASETMTFAFFGSCCHPVLLCPAPGSHEWSLLQPSRALALDPLVALRMAGDAPSCALQLRASHANASAFSPLGIAVAPGMLAQPSAPPFVISAMSVHVVVYLANGSAAATLPMGSFTPYLEYLDGCGGVLATDPRDVAVVPPLFFDQFGYQCPDSYAAELPLAPAAEFYAAFYDMVPAVFAPGSNRSIAIVVPNLGPGDFFYAGEITVLLANATSPGSRFLRYLNGDPCLNNTLGAHTCACGPACDAQRVVASPVLIDSGVPLLR
jgi:hypothetical protein